MKAVCWMGTEKMNLSSARTTILNPRDAIVRITSTCICGSDLHLYDGSCPPWNKATLWAMSLWAKSWKLARA